MLEELEIGWMENLEKVWPNNQIADEEPLPELIEFRLECCKKIRYVLPLSMSKRLQRLKKLKIDNCELVEEIFEPQLPVSPERFPSSSVAQAENVITLKFPQLTKLSLRDLPNLKSFYHGTHTISFPSLKKGLKVCDCDKVKVLFASNFPETSGNKQQENLIQLPLFCLDKESFINLEEFSFGATETVDGMKEIWHAYGPGHNMKEYFPALKAVELKVHIKDMAQSYLKSLPNLECLKVRIYGYGGPGVGGDDEHEHELNPSSSLALLADRSRSTELSLDRVKELRYLWKDREGIFQNNIGDHGFINLVKLDVYGCRGMVKLVTPSVAKSMLLVHLQQMNISWCYNLEEIIDADGEGEVVKAESICFPKLKHLELSTLKKLESFSSSGNYTFQFPSLQTVQLNDCPNMKMFSPADPSTPSCFKVIFGRKERYSSNSLNKTVQEMLKLEEAY
ncbi:disease resistance protein, partial [Corchorus capsularis]